VTVLTLNVFAYYLFIVANCVLTVFNKDNDDDVFWDY